MAKGENRRARCAPLVSADGAPLSPRALFRRVCRGAVVSPDEVLCVEYSVATEFESQGQCLIAIESADRLEDQTRVLAAADEERWWRAVRDRIPGLRRTWVQLRGADVVGPSGDLPCLPGAQARFVARVMACVEEEIAAQVAVSLWIRDPADPSSVKIGLRVGRPHLCPPPPGLDEELFRADGEEFAALVGPWLSGCLGARFVFGPEPVLSRHERLESRLRLEGSFFEAVGQWAGG